MSTDAVMDRERVTATARKRLESSIHFKLDDTLRQNLRAIAALEGVGLSDVVRDAVIRGCEARDTPIT